MKKLIIIGGSGHGKVAADIAKLNGYEDIVFLDDNEALASCGDYPVVGKSESISEHEGEVFIAVGNPKIRKELIERLHKDGRTIATLIHPSAVIASLVTIGEGTIIAAGAIINPGATIGKACIINTASSIDHDCKIGDYVHISVGAHVAGTVIIGDNTWVGAGATIINNLKICESVMVGAGATVIKDIIEGGTYVGTPAGKLS